MKHEELKNIIETSSFKDWEMGVSEEARIYKNDISISLKLEPYLLEKTQELALDKFKNKYIKDQYPDLMLPIEEFTFINYRCFICFNSVEIFSVDVVYCEQLCFYFPIVIFNDNQFEMNLVEILTKSMDMRQKHLNFAIYNFDVFVSNLNRD